MFGVTILGNNSALPTLERHPTAQVITIHDQLILIDCGEGTQMQMSKYKIKRSKVNHIFISHLHGDHYFGLIGLITSMSLMNREQDLHIYGPSRLEEIITIQLEVGETNLSYKLHFHALVEEGMIAEGKRFTVECFKTEHRIECWGFIVREKKNLLKLNQDKVHEYKIPSAYYESIIAGKDYETKTGEIIKNEWLTTPRKPARSYAYCADTLFSKHVAEKAIGVSMMYHETTYLKIETVRASLRFHSTTEQAANIALEAKTKRLLIGHFSSKYELLDDFELEARAIFPNTDLAIEGVTYRVMN